MIPENTEIINFGESSTFREQYELYFIPLKYFAIRYVDDEDLACDFIQDVFLNLWNTRRTFQNEVAVKVFLYRTIRNACLNHIRDTEIHDKHHQCISELQTEECFFNHIIETETYFAIKKVFDQLPESTRRIYKLSLDGKSHSEIAELLNISVNTIKKHKNTANHFMRERLKNTMLLILMLRD